MLITVENILIDDQLACVGNISHDLKSPKQMHDMVAPFSLDAPPRLCSLPVLTTLFSHGE